MIPSFSAVRSACFLERMIGPRDWQIFEVAKRQHGVVSYAQLDAAGMSSSARARKIQEGEFVSVLPSVVRLYWADSCWIQRAWAVSLWGGILSHRTAAVLHGMGLPPGDQIHVLKRRGGNQTERDWLSIHVSTSTSSDVREIGGLRVTSAARTLVDLMPELGEEEHFALAMRALREGRLTQREFTSTFSELSAGRFGPKRLRRLVDGAKQAS